MKTTTTTNRLIIAIVIVILVGAFVLYFMLSTHSEKITSQSPPPNRNIVVKTFKSPLQWGYIIEIDGHETIKQKSIPAVEGNQGFQTAYEARLVGDLVADKIKRGKLPTVHIHELDSLKISR